MTQEEFAKLTGFTPDQDYYVNVIEREYNGSVLEKREWCKKWIENGGIQKAYDAMKEDAKICKESYECTVKEYRHLRDDYDKLLKERDDALEKLYGSKNAIDAVIGKLSYLFDQCKSEQDDLSALITKLIEVKIL